MKTHGDEDAVNPMLKRGNMPRLSIVFSPFMDIP